MFVLGSFHHLVENLVFILRIAFNLFRNISSPSKVTVTNEIKKTKVSIKKPPIKDKLFQGLKGKPKADSKGKPKLKEIVRNLPYNPRTARERDPVTRISVIGL